MSHITVEEIDGFFKKNPPPKDKAIRLDPATYIEDIEGFINSHIVFLKSNPKNITYLPYYQRLLTIYEFFSKPH